ncbi:hypothetical protein PIB30_072759 [Stylosanthes scabra]|uniref:Uncharacterized protein n=1 Tax=Stylosanthes scabra TaxID=79078 RepID=A0ABU6TQQ4_9FABA|nr:hypothetical protein [Stylosanthes scabra]
MPILSNGRMGGINPVPNVLGIHNNVEPRYSANSNNPSTVPPSYWSNLGLQRGLALSARSALTLVLTFDREVARVRHAAAWCGYNPPKWLPGYRAKRRAGAQCPVPPIFVFLLSILAFHVLPSLPYAFLDPYKSEIQ